MGVAAASLPRVRSPPVALAATDGAFVHHSTVLVAVAVVEPAQVGVVRRVTEPERLPAALAESASRRVLRACVGGPRLAPERVHVSPDGPNAHVEQVREFGHCQLGVEPVDLSTASADRRCFPLLPGGQEVGEERYRICVECSRERGSHLRRRIRNATLDPLDVTPRAMDLRGEPFLGHPEELSSRSKQ